MRSFSKFLLLVVLFSPLFAVAQHEESEREEESEEEFTHHRVIVATVISIIPEGVDAVNNTVLVPAIGIDYEYWFNEKWAISSKNDIMLQQYFIEDNEGSLVEREGVFIMTVTGVYELATGLSFFLGGGAEFEKEKNYALFKVGFEYRVNVCQGWDVAVPLYWDIKEEYNTVTFGIAIGKNF